MSKRILLDITPYPKSDAAMMEFIVDLGVFMEKQIDEHVLEDYGIALETPVTWFVKISAKATEEIEEAEK